MTQDDGDPRTVLLTGVYGTGKSSVAVEIADILEKQSVAYAVLDLDWLSWFQAPGHEPHSDQRMLLANVRAVIDNYLGAGVRRFILAQSIQNRTDLDAIRGTVPAPMTVVRLTVPLAEIRRRLRSDVTVGRQDDLRVAEAWLAGSVGVGLEDFTLPNDRPIREVALDILERLDWR
ncbi:MAG: adenylyl-sulfate kinase [Chloroflexota bacterium]